MLDRLLFLHLLLFPLFSSKQSEFLAGLFKRSKNKEHAVGESAIPQHVAKGKPTHSKLIISNPSVISLPVQHVRVADENIPSPSTIQIHFITSFNKQRTSFCYWNCLVPEVQEKYNMIFKTAMEYLNQLDKSNDFRTDILNRIFVGFLDKLYVHILRSYSLSSIDDILDKVYKSFMNTFKSKLEKLFINPPPNITYEELIEIALGSDEIRSAVSYMTHKISHSSIFWNKYLSVSEKVRSFYHFIYFLYGDEAALLFSNYLNQNFRNRDIDFINNLHQRLFELRLDSIIILDFFSSNPYIATYVFLVSMVNDDYFICIRSIIKKFIIEAIMKIEFAKSSGGNLLTSSINDQTLKLLRRNKLSEQSLYSLEKERDQFSMKVH